MALKRWVWVWGPALAAVLAALLALPPGIPSETNLLVAIGAIGDWTYGGSRTPHREAVQGAVATLKRRLRDAQLVDSLARAARGPRALRSADGQVTVTYETPLTRDSARVWLEAAEGELALYPTANAGGVPVVVALASDPSRWRRKEYRDDWEWQGVRQLLSAIESHGVCAVTIDLHARYVAEGGIIGRNAEGTPVGRFLDLCALYARFGMPGAAGRWAIETTSPWWYYRYPLSIAVQDARRPVRRGTVVHDEQGGSVPWSGAVQWVDIGCLHGSFELCARRAGFDRTESRWFYPYGRYFSRLQVLGYLLTQGTSAQFAAFWHSSQPAATALAAAYEKPAGQLVRSAFAHWYDIPEAGGPPMGGRALLAGLFWAGLALAVAVTAGRRRTVQP